MAGGSSLHCWLSLLVCAAFWPATPIHGQIVRRADPPPPPRQLEDIVQMPDGQIWGSGLSRAGHLFSYRDGQWDAHPVTELSEAYPKNLTALGPNTFACWWETRNQSNALSLHRQGEAPVVNFNTPRLEQPHFLACADGSLVVTQNGPRVLRLSPDGKVEEFALPQTFFTRRKDDPKSNYYERVDAVDLGSGGLWFGSFAMFHYDTAYYLKGLTTLHDGQFTQPKIQGLRPNETISGLLQMEDGECWLAKVGQGLFLFTPEKLKVTKAQVTSRPSHGNPFAYVHELFNAGHDSYAIAYPRSPSDAGPGQGDLRIHNEIVISYISYHEAVDPVGALYRYRAGVWDLVLEGIDEKPWYHVWDRPVLATPAGLLLGSFDGRGVWLLPENPAETPMRHDWLQDFPLEQPKRLCLVAPDQFLALDRGLVPCRQPIVPPRDLSVSRLQTLTTVTPLIADARGDVWGFRAGSRWTKWHAGKPQDQPVPVELLRQSLGHFCADDRDRAWLLRDDSVAICTFKTGQWERFESLDAAYAAQLPTGVQLERTDFPCLEPAYSGDGRIAYCDANETLHAFAAGRWRTWRLATIAGARAGLDGPAYFVAGQLCVSLDGKAYEWDPASAKWGLAATPSAPPHKGVYAPPVTEVPPDCPIKQSYGVIADTAGVCWIANYDGSISKAIAGKTVSALMPDEPKPFVAGHHTFRRLVVDATGIAYLEYDAEYGAARYIVLSPGAPIPKPTAELVRAEGQTATVRLGVDAATSKRLAPSDVCYSWRLDDGPWQPAQSSPEVRLNGLSAGKHRLQARSYDVELNTNASPAAVEWESPGERQAQ